MTRPLELGIFALFYTKLGKNTPYNKKLCTWSQILNVAHFLGVFPIFWLDGPLELYLL